jgi:hypothetical protein
MGLVRRSRGERWPAVSAGLALLGLMVLHAALRPEHAWVLLATCDVAALATAAGLIFGWERCLGAALVFQVAIGLPAFAVGLCTTYPSNVTGIAIHLVPPILGAAVFAGRALPRYAAAFAWIGYVTTVLVSYVVAPPAAFNINFTTAVWPPLAHTFPVRAEFYAVLFAIAAMMLRLGARGLGRVLRGSGRR